MIWSKWNVNKSIALLAFWHGFSLLMTAVFNWPKEIIWLNFGLSSAFILLSETYYGLLLLIVLIPFYSVLPNPYFESLSFWRPLFLLLFIAWLVKGKRLNVKNFGLMPWDKILGYFAVASLIITLLFARFIPAGLKQLLFLINIYVFYAVLVNEVKTRKQILGALKAGAVSLGIIIVFGFLQLMLTFFVGLNFFWVYWADNISRIFYGNFFAEAALYSNSWFSYTGGWNLRMFGLQPDSQSFAYLSVFAIAFFLPLFLVFSGKIQNWLRVSFASLAVVFSGTRAIWLGILMPFFAALWFYAKKIQAVHAKKMLLIFALFFFFLAASPFINTGISYIRTAKFEKNFTLRALSIYDLNETSNKGRILIWKESLLYFVQKPWGGGLANFISNLNPSENYQEASAEINKRYNLPQKYISAHSLYLQILVELGVAGFVLFAWLWASIGKTCYYFLKKYRTIADPLVFFVFATAMVFLWILAAAFFDVTLFNDKVLIFFFISLGLSGIIMENYERLKEM